MESGNPVRLNEEEGQVFGYTIAPRSSLQFSTSGSGTDVDTGYVRIEANAGSGRPGAFAVLHWSRDGILVDEASVTALRGRMFPRLFVESSGAFATPESIRQGAALINTKDQSVTLTYELVDHSGAPTGLSGMLQLPPGGYRSAFLHELPGLEGVTREFSGTLRIDAGGSRFSPGSVVAIGLRGRWNQQGDFLFSTREPAVPSAELDAQSLIIPHLAFGGGYDTRIVVFTDDGSSSGTLRFFDPDGTLREPPVD